MSPPLRQPEMSISPKGGNYTPTEVELAFEYGDARRTQRYAAGATFFNYAELGSLRPGQESLNLFSKQHIGLAIHVVLSGFAYYFFTYGFGQLLAEYLRANDKQQVNAANYVLVWPMALSIFIGLISDAFPIRGYRRKSYMVLGWVVSILCYVALIVMDTYGDSSQRLFSSALKDEFDLRASEAGKAQASRFPVAYLVVSLVAAFGIQISWVATAAISIEFAQHEFLYHRGRIQGTMLALYYLGGLVAEVLTACVISEGVNSDHVASSISIRTSAIILAVVSVVAIPCVVFFCEEEPSWYTVRIGSTVSSSSSMRQRVSHFWKFCHQNVVYRVVFFIGVHLFLLGIYNQNVRDSVQQWSGVSRRASLWVEVGRLGAELLGTLVWKMFLRNQGWRAIALSGTLVYIASYALLTLLTVNNVVRSQWFYGLLVSIADIPRAWLVVFTFILATEIADIGHEGVTVAIGISFQTLSALACYVLAAIFPSTIGFNVSDDDVRQDSAGTRTSVTIAFVITLVLNLLSLPVVRLLPQQKLDAQQMRAFGGYNKCAGAALGVVFVLLLVFNLAVNLVVVL